MNNICANCGGYVGEFMWSGDGAKICTCYHPKQETNPMQKDSNLMQEVKEDWEKELREYLWKMDGRETYEDIRWIVDFVKSLLSSERQRLREEIEEKYKASLNDDWKEFENGYNQALSDILKLLEE